MKFMSFEVGDGWKIFLWLDSWLPEGALLDNYGHRVIYDVVSHLKLW